MSTFDAGLRGGGIAVLLLLAVIGWRDARHVPVARYAILFAICAAASLIDTAPHLADEHAAWIVPIRVLSITTPAIFQLWAAATFDDSFRPSWRVWLLPVAMAALADWALVANTNLAWRTVQVAALALVGLGVWRAVSGRSADLVESRRRFRLVLAIGAGLTIGAFTILAAVTSAPIRGYGSLIGAALTLALAATAALIRLGVRLRPDIAPEPVSADAVPAAPAETPAIDPEEHAWLDRLRHVMEVDRLYRQEGLGIADLADRLGLPEYRLRRLINQGLGHRNFNGFINGYRLADAISALSDPGQAEVSVLTIALDAGFQSIGPFNRAFKAKTGLTPTDFRRDALERARPRLAG